MSRLVSDSHYSDIEFFHRLLKISLEDRNQAIAKALGLAAVKALVAIRTSEVLAGDTRRPKQSSDDDLALEVTHRNPPSMISNLQVQPSDGVEHVINEVHSPKDVYRYQRTV
ncbi:hypothetical protein L1987_09737 [Smallanthus sonchifolius]|uniref:Uncharacterized protein n=1 Tax=Smallanthus sonchifolius TaxID=185202 RepID=A0ACB9JQ74_9ASTR|nr:hypothetical protein L1987_09737 [Smallanthus sonchifolius]